MKVKVNAHGVGMVIGTVMLKHQDFKHFTSFRYLQFLQHKQVMLLLHN